MKHEEKVRKLVRIIQQLKLVIDSKDAELSKYEEEYDSLRWDNSPESIMRRREIIAMGPTDEDYNKIGSAWNSLQKQLTKHDYYLVCKKNNLK